MVVQLKSSGDNQPFSSLQWRMAVPGKKKNKKDKENQKQIKKFLMHRESFTLGFACQATIAKS